MGRRGRLDRPSLRLHWKLAYFPGSGLINWDYSDLAGAFTDNQDYTIKLRATDWAGSVTTPADTVFKYDTSLRP